MRAAAAWTLLTAVGLAAGCAAMPPTCEDLDADRQEAWTVLDRVMTARLTVEERNADCGRLAGVTAAERITAPAPGLGGRVLGVQSAQTVRRQVSAHLWPTDGASRLAVTAWVQRYDPVAAGTLADLVRDPADVATSGVEGPSAPRPTWIDLERDQELEKTLLQAVKDRLKPH